MEARWELIVVKSVYGAWRSLCWHCSNCGRLPMEPSLFPSTQEYCCHCGAHMVEKPELKIDESEPEVLTWD